MASNIFSILNPIVETETTINNLITDIITRPMSLVAKNKEITNFQIFIISILSVKNTATFEQTG